MEFEVELEVELLVVPVPLAEDIIVLVVDGALGLDLGPDAGTDDGIDGELDGENEMAAPLPAAVPIDGAASKEVLGDVGAIGAEVLGAGVGVIMELELP